MYSPHLHATTAPNIATSSTDGTRSQARELACAEARSEANKVMCHTMRATQSCDERNGFLTTGRPFDRPQRRAPARACWSGVEAT